MRHFLFSKEGGRNVGERILCAIGYKTVFSPPRSWHDEIFSRKARPFAEYREIRDVCHLVGKQREREGGGECGWKVEIAIWISIKRKFHLPEISDRDLHLWENARIISSSVQSKINIIYFMLISKNFFFSFLLEPTLLPKLAYHVYLYLLLKRRWKNRIIWENNLY